MYRFTIYFHSGIFFLLFLLIIFLLGIHQQFSFFVRSKTDFKRIVDVWIFTVEIEFFFCFIVMSWNSNWNIWVCVKVRNTKEKISGVSTENEWFFFLVSKQNYWKECAFFFMIVVIKVILINKVIKITCLSRFTLN